MIQTNKIRVVSVGAATPSKEHIDAAIKKANENLLTRPKRLQFPNVNNW